MLYNNQDQKKIRKYLRNNSTPQEIILWGYLRNSNLGCKFRRQQGIGPYIVDFYCKTKKLIIELDGSQHLDDKKYDDERTHYMETLGFIVVRFWNNEVNKNIDYVIDQIRKYTTPSPS